MCGIAGFLQLNDASISEGSAGARLEKMLDAIFHRGPDESGRLVDQELAMGMRRLSIIDLQDGSQPIYNETGRFGVVFNGEIYNYVELRQDLQRRGHQFKTQSDTEVIVHLFEEYGADCVEHLRGMFGFAVWDNENRTLFIARDRLGIKPLYYTQHDGCLYFASEIKALLSVGSIPREVDPIALSHYLSLKYIPAPRTLFKGIYSLLPGHHMTIQDGIPQTRRYWDVSFEKNRDWDPANAADEQSAVQELGEILRESVRLRLRSDVPFGAFLSGGLDSSVIVALMSEALDSPVNTFSVGFAEAEGQDELPYAQTVADQFGCTHRTLSIGSDDFLNHAETVLWHLDQPIADQATVATHLVAKLARQHVKMVLTGEGGDELFAGYARYAGEQFHPWTVGLPAMVGGMLRRFTRSMPGLRRAKIAIGALTQKDEATRFANWFPMFADDAKVQLLQSWDSVSPASEIFANYLNQTDAKSPLDRMLYCDTKNWLVDYLLLRGDKLTMANSLEARVPLLDHKLVEFAAGLPPQWKLNGKSRKHLLKQFARTVLPDSIIDRKKQGFPIPIERWLRKEARPMMRDLLAPATLHKRGLFNESFVSQLMSQHESGYADNSTELWGLMSFEMWMQRFIDSAPQGTVASPPLAEATS